MFNHIQRIITEGDLMFTKIKHYIYDYTLIKVVSTGRKTDVMQR